MKKPWGGRFTAKTDRMVEKFSESISFDRRLWAEDIEGSIAHVTMLAKQKIIPRTDASVIIAGLKEIVKEIAAGTFPMRPEFEDIHMAIEARLKEKIGDVAGKLHTARSRNDQVTLDSRLYLKKQIVRLFDSLEALQRVFVTKAREYRSVPMPGYTHLQRAQPVFLGHYLLAYVEMWERDKGRLVDCARRLDQSPLGAGALAGTTFPLDRAAVAAALGFSGITGNSMDTVADRDYMIEFLSAAAILMMHCSRLCEDMIIWNSREFRFVVLPDGFCTGSSIMPQKKNPDVLELVRGKTGRVYGSLTALLTIMKGLPLTYNRDMQEDKEPLFDAVDTVGETVAVLASLFAKVSFDVRRCTEEARTGFLLATEIADYLSRKGLPFRDAHEVTGKIVAYCEKKGRELDELTLAEYRSFSPLFDADIADAVSVEKAVSARNTAGGTGARALADRLLFWTKKLGM